VTVHHTKQIPRIEAPRNEMLQSMTDQAYGASRPDVMPGARGGGDEVNGWKVRRGARGG